MLLPPTKREKKKEDSFLQNENYSYSLKEQESVS